MNGFIEEVCTQGLLMKEVIEYYKKEKTIDSIVETFRNKGMKRKADRGRALRTWAFTCQK